MSAVFKLHPGDCIATMRGMAAASIDSIVTDPPYELGFMGKTCMREGFNFIGCELSPEYLAIAKARIEHEQLQAAIRAYDAMLKAA